jgi:hypothetical protein
MVSLKESEVFDEQGNRTDLIQAHWVLDFAKDEYSTGAPQLQNQVIYLTTARPSNERICGQQTNKEGRLYGVHYTRVLESNYIDPFGDRSLNVVPMIPRFNAQGERLSNALSVTLPPGYIAHGVSVIPTPSCSLNGATITELVMNLSTESDNLIPNPGQIGFEYVGNQEEIDPNQVQTLEKSSLNKGLAAKMIGDVFQLQLIAGSENAPSSAIFTPLSPFPSQVLYWGSGFEN